MKTKICTNCGEEKELSEFAKAKTGKFGVRGDCKSCRSEYQKNLRLFDPQKYREISKKSYQKNKKNVLLKNRDYRLNNKYYYEFKHKQWYNNNKDKINKNRRIRYHTDINYRVKENLRRRLNLALNKNIKSESTSKLLGCSIEKLKEHLESQFTEGMTWDNYGFYGWHVDHIKPCVSFDLSDPEEQHKCFHYTNLQPLWAEENRVKWHYSKEYNGSISA